MCLLEVGWEKGTGTSNSACPCQSLMPMAFWEALWGPPQKPMCVPELTFRPAPHRNLSMTAREAMVTTPRRLQTRLLIELTDHFLCPSPYLPQHLQEVCHDAAEKFQSQSTTSLNHTFKSCLSRRGRYINSRPHISHPCPQYK